MYSGFAGMHRRTANASPLPPTMSSQLPGFGRFRTSNLRDPPRASAGRFLHRAHSRSERMSKRIRRQDEREPRRVRSRLELDATAHQARDLTRDREAEAAAG